MHDSHEFQKELAAELHQQKLKQSCQRNTPLRQHNCRYAIIPRHCQELYAVYGVKTAAAALLPAMEVAPESVTERVLAQEPKELTTLVLLSATETTATFLAGSNSMPPLPSIVGNAAIADGWTAPKLVSAAPIQAAGSPARTSTTSAMTASLTIQSNTCTNNTTLTQLHLHSCTNTNTNTTPPETPIPHQLHQQHCIDTIATKPINHARIITPQPPHQMTKVKDKRRIK
jgi:hypothetical protein